MGKNQNFPNWGKSKISPIGGKSKFPQLGKNQNFPNWGKIKISPIGGKSKFQNFEKIKISIIFPSIYIILPQIQGNAIWKKDFLSLNHKHQMDFFFLEKRFMHHKQQMDFFISRPYQMDFFSRKSENMIDANSKYGGLFGNSFFSQ